VRDRSGRPEAKPLRLFVAVDVPPAVQDGLAVAIASYRDRIPLARWTGLENWHVTVKFLGTTWPRLVDPVRAAIGSAASAAAPFQTALTEVGVFPSARRARVVWAGLSDPDGGFARLADSLDGALGEFVEPERRPFTPHLTLARLTPPRDIGEFTSDLVGRSVASEPFPVEHLVLYQSHLSPRGATYESLEVFALGR